MEKTEAAAVVLQAPPEIVPVANVMHRLVLDKVFEDRRRGVPVDPPQFEKAGVEPGPQQMLEIRGNRRPFRMAGGALQHTTPHLDERRRAGGREIQPAEQLAAWRL